MPQYRHLAPRETTGHQPSDGTVHKLFEKNGGLCSNAAVHGPGGAGAKLGGRCCSGPACRQTNGRALLPRQVCPRRNCPRSHAGHWLWCWSGLRGGMRACAFACAMRLVAGMHSTLLWPAPTSRHWAQAAQSSAICQALQHAKTRWRHLRTSHRVSGLVQLRY